MYVFITSDEMTSVIDLNEFPESCRADIAYRRYMDYTCDMIYIKNNAKIIGIVSIGDLERFYVNNDKVLKINQNYSYGTDLDEERASSFFQKVKTCCEFPILNAQGNLIGVYKKEKDYLVRREQVASLIVAKYMGEQWHRRELKRFVEGTKAKVVIYYSDEAQIMESLRASDKNTATTDDKKWKDLSEKQWNKFLGEEGAVDCLIKEFGSFHTELKKGISVVADMESEFYNCKNGCRLTVDSPKESDRRIIFYGPCTIAGAYCRDEHTIESFLQKLINEQSNYNIKVENKGFFNPYNLFSQMITDMLSERDIVIFYGLKRWITDEISEKCEIVGDLTNTFLGVPNLEDCIVDIPDHCNYIVNECIAQRIYHDLEEKHLLNNTGIECEAFRIQDYYIGIEILAEIFLYMEKNKLLPREDNKVIGAFAQLFDPFSDRHKEAIIKAIRKVDKLYIFVQEDSNLSQSLEERLQAVKDGVSDLDKVVVVPAGKYIYSKKISRCIRKEILCDDDMEYDCDIFGNIFGQIMGINYRFILSETGKFIEQRYIETCKTILPKFGVNVELV